MEQEGPIIFHTFISLHEIGFVIVVAIFIIYFAFLKPSKNENKDND
jgi:hypothetical protein